ncbi:MAG: ATP-dependent DNA helicase RecG [Candidatus Saccharibacteria bacterium]|nr:ATP-dependent DNA helicase RecG [Candidatus Saccharibacteria bacterium]
MRLDDSVEKLKGVGPQVAKKLNILGVRTVFDLIDYIPRRYDDYSDLQDIARLKPGPVSLKAVIKQAKGRYARRGLHITEAVASDETGSVKLVWFNQPYRAAALKPGTKYYVSGEFGFNYKQLSITNPSVELASSFPVNTARILPVYRQTKGFTSKQIRKAVYETLPLIKKLPETLPPWLIKSQKLMARSDAYEALHFPRSSEELAEARQRLAFEEVFRLSLTGLLAKRENERVDAASIPFDEALARKFVKHLPFDLTDDQRRAVWKVYQDIQKHRPMNTLLEGDVGSGKTVVAAMSVAMAMKEDYQTALIAPTELLARQHADTLTELLEPLRMADRVQLLVGGMTSKQKQNLKNAIQKRSGTLLIGTHALLESDVLPKNLALIIVDEQHRFGVEQRKKLMKKSKQAPHVLSMTATPIPRSLALTLYGEMDVTLLREKPGGREPVETRLIPPTDRTKLYGGINQQVRDGRQVFVVCPLVSKSDSLPAKSAEEVYDTLRKGAFKNRRVGLLHGKMKPEEKDQVMQDFVKRKIDVLVSTTVIEVGVDVPNATVMLVENPERFGLAQLHQLRGRVGRGEHQGYCYLMLSDSQQPSRRLRAIAASNDGFKLAELDLDIRGPGAIYGTLQHGALDLRIAKLTDVRLIKRARHAAETFIEKGESLLDYEELHKHITDLQKVTQLN